MMNKLKDKRVMVVDDDSRNIFALTSYLETFDMNIDVAENGQEALDRLRQKRLPDIILLDMMMPVMDGYEVLGILKGDDSLKHIPVIAVTAKAMKGDKENCLKAGAWDYVSKPFDLRILIEKMTNWVL